MRIYLKGKMKKVILNRPKLIHTSSMIKNTHSLEQVETLMWKESDILKDPNVGKERKKESLKKLKLLEKHFTDCKDKHLNGKKYPVKEKPPVVSKKELLELIDSVNVEDNEMNCYTSYLSDNVNKITLDVTGVFIK